MQPGEKYELKNSEPDELIASTPVYVFLTRWSIPVFIVIMGLLIILLSFIRVSSTYETRASLFYDSTSAKNNAVLYCKTEIPEDFIHSIKKGGIVVASFFNLANQKTYNLEGEIDSVFLEQKTSKYYSAIVIRPGKSINELDLYRNAGAKQPAKLLFTLSKRSILGSFF